MQSILKQTGAEEISSTGEASADNTAGRSSGGSKHRYGVLLALLPLTTRALAQDTLSSPSLTDMSIEELMALRIESVYGAPSWNGIPLDLDLIDREMRMTCQRGALCHAAPTPRDIAYTALLHGNEDIGVTG